MINTIKRLIPKSLKLFILKFINGNYFYFFKLFPIKENKVVIVNYWGKGYGDNGKAIAEELLNRSNKVDLVWLLDDNNEKNKSLFPQEIRTVEYKSVRALYELATAKVWIDNTRKYLFPPKKGKQFYIQTWHSPFGLKFVEKDAEDYLSYYYVERAKKDSTMIDLMVVGSEFAYRRIKRAFWYEGDISKIGTPRCDIFFNKNNEIITKVYEYYNISMDTKLILYAPTFRKSGNLDIYKLDFDKILIGLNLNKDANFKILIRLHPNISNKSNFMKYNKNIINASDYPDIQELLFASEYLITDYSSSMFDMLIARKKCLLYVPDLNEYMTNDRPLSFELETLPFPITKTSEEIITEILTFDEIEYAEKINKFEREIGMFEKGTASDKITDKIFDVLHIK